ncbi:unnamed protein product [Auanema sp. JU1783]|nr:unnamed protein product [Auanema sp. JU1783]
MLQIAILLSTVMAAYSATYGDRYVKDYRDYAIDDTQNLYPSRPVTHTFPNRTQCFELCELPCSVTHVYMGLQNIEMFNCAKLRPPKISVLGSIRGNSFYMTLVVLGCITVGVVTLLTICFCCSYCCRPSASSRGSSKDALARNESEFREYLTDTDSMMLRAERDHARKSKSASGFHV